MKTKHCLESYKENGSAVRLPACQVGSASFAIENTKASSNHHTCMSRNHEDIVEFSIAAIERINILYCA